MEEKNKKHYKIMTKVMHIITKLSRIFLIIGTVCLVIALFVVPIIGRSIKFDANTQTIEVLDQTIVYEKEDGNYIFYVNDDDFKVTAKGEIEAIDAILERLEEDNLARAVTAVEVALMIGVATLIFNYLALRNIDQVFLGINKDDTPFAKEHPTSFRNAGQYFVVVFIIRIVGSIIASAIAGFSISINFGVAEILIILALFTLAYIFEYGYKLQSNSNIKMIEE